MSLLDNHDVCSGEHLVAQGDVKGKSISNFTMQEDDMEFKYTADGPYDRYQRLERKLRSRLIREGNVDIDDPDSGAPKVVREKYQSLIRLAFSRYLAEVYN